MKRFILFLMIFGFLFAGCDLISNSGKQKVELSDINDLKQSASDWLVIIYADGDNSLDWNIYSDVNEAEYGLSFIRGNDGFPKTGFDSVNVVVLWDGLYSNNGENASRLLELGPDKKINYEFSSKTRNFSFLVKDWISPTGQLDENGFGEVSMSSPETLTKFLLWVDENYSSKHKILIFGDHGSGPGNYYSRGLESRAICQDITTSSDGYSVLSTRGVANALKNAGYGKDKKFDILMMDVCFGASIEEAYEYKDFADFYVASPNLIPGNGTNYARLIYSFTKGTEPQELCRKIVSNYYTDYIGKNELKEVNFYSEKYDREEMHLYDTFTLTVSCLPKIQNVVEKFSGLCELLINEGFSRIYKDGISFSEYIGNNFVKLSSSLSDCENTLHYTGTMNHLYDFGWMLNRIISISDNWLELKNSAQSVYDALNDAIVYSWRDGYFDEESHKYGMYSRLDGNRSSDFSGHAYGLTIAGGSVRNKNYVSENRVYPWYETDLLFGEETPWFNLLKTWFLIEK